MLPFRVNTPSIRMLHDRSFSTLCIHNIGMVNNPKWLNSRHIWIHTSSQRSHQLSHRQMFYQTTEENDECNVNIPLAKLPFQLNSPHFFSAYAQCVICMNFESNIIKIDASSCYFEVKQEPVFGWDHSKKQRKKETLSIFVWCHKCKPTYRS